jgi:hypothetical protein
VSEPGRIIALEGPSGAGKSTVVRAAARAYGWTALAEAFDRLAPPPALRFRTARELLQIERVLLMEERHRYREAERRRRQGETVIADTGFLGPVTYTAGLVALGEAPPGVLKVVRRLAESPSGIARAHLPDLIVYLDAPAAVRRRRASDDPARHPVEFRRRHEAVGRWERRFYRDLALGSMPGQVRFVRANAPPRILAARIRALARTSHPGPEKPCPLVRLFDRVDALAIEASRRRRRVVRRRRHR